MFALDCFADARNDEPVGWVERLVRRSGEVREGGSETHQRPRDCLMGFVKAQPILRADEARPKQHDHESEVHSHPANDEQTEV
jgi:hypothetical protein